MPGEFDIDPRNKLGADIDWEEEGAFDEFVRALNSGSSQLGGSAVVASPSESGEPRTLTAIDVAELRSLLAQYR